MPETMDESNCSKLDRELEQFQKWTVSILLTLQTGPDGDVIDNVNLVEIIDQINATGKKAPKDPKKRYYLPTAINRKDELYRQQSVVCVFVHACKKSGIEIRIRTFQNNVLSLMCVRGRHYSAQQSKNNTELARIRKHELGGG
jgi:hypothetical protein